MATALQQVREVIDRFVSRHSAVQVTQASETAYIFCTIEIDEGFYCISDVVVYCVEANACICIYGVCVFSGQLVKRKHHVRSQMAIKMPLRYRMYLQNLNYNTTCDRFAE
jgi:hypothetical protein